MKVSTPAKTLGDVQISICQEHTVLWRSTALLGLQVYGYCMFTDGREAKVAYPTEGLTEDIAGRSFHNGRFVQRLRQAAAAQPNITVRQGTVTALLNGESYVQYQLHFIDHKHILGLIHISADAATTMLCT